MKITALLTALLLFSCNKETPKGWIDEERLASRTAGDWLALGGDHKMQHYSPLNQINLSNISSLGLAWEYDASSTIGRVPRGLEATPIIVDGLLYTSGAWGFVYALNARTGEEIWRYDPHVDASWAVNACCDVVNRGVAVWKGKVYVGTLDGYLVCLDAVSGKEVWRKDTFTDRSKAYSITGPPQVAGNIVMIGNSGGEFGVRGYITAYDLNSGEQKWRFFVVPGDPTKGFEHEEMEMASRTWDPKSHWIAGGGGTSWGESAYDPALNLLYVGTGNSTPYPIWIRSPSGGDNLFLASILAINPDNGKLVWHYQTTPGEIWDYTATMNLVLADVEIGGSVRKVIMQAPKNGFFYVIDRATGELLSAEKYTRVNWASHVDLKTGRPVLTGQGQWYKDKPKLVIPALAGGHNWQPMSYNPVTGLVYIPEHTVPFVYNAVKAYQWGPKKDNTALDYNQLVNFKSVVDQVTESADTTFTESLLAWDPVTQKAAWQIKEGAPDGGILSTPELVIQGTRTGYLKVYDARTGKMVKEIFTGTGIMAAPSTYTVDGEQYITVMAGYGGAPVAYYPADAAMYQYQNKGRILSFKLNGMETPLPPKREAIATPEPPNVKIDDALVNKGFKVYDQYCIGCHGWFGDGHTSLHPDLAKLPLATHHVFSDIVLGGLLSANGMTSFKGALGEDEVNAIHHFLIKQQKELFDKQRQASK
ncbi:MAG TPA: PQQ-dependent dehydrogenase, methanol/ethanol family [Chryseolinea sp.]|nr:PQQ-dependent dehydrogenase, methanol/ethanol family [Chryseolinea sp.]